MEDHRYHLPETFWKLRKLALKDELRPEMSCLDLTESLLCAMCGTAKVWVLGGGCDESASLATCR